ncbi:hypothetical protein ACHAQA_001586 [Verticillium albo-atrum]
MVSAAYLATFLAVASGVVAQGGLEQCTGLTTLFPACATACVLSAASAVGCTNGLDLRCRCNPASSAQIQASAFGCVLGNCNADPTQIESAINAGASVCACVNAAPTAVPSEPPISSPPVVSPPAPSSPPVPSEPPSSAAPSSGPPPSAPSSEPASEEPSSSVPPVVPSSVEPSSPGPITPAPSTPGGGEDCDPVSPCEDAAQAVPACGRSCIISAASASVGCAADDYECQCGGFQAIQAGAAPCVIDSCGIAGAVPLLGSVSALCRCVTANPSTPCTASSEPSVTSEPPPPGSSGGEPPVESSEAPPGPGESSVPPGPGTTAPPTTCAPPTPQDCGPVATSAVPACAQPCFLQAAPNVGCDADDYACQCEAEAQASLTQLLVPCVATACPAASLQAVITGASSVCACASATPTGGDDDCPGETNVPQPSGKPTTKDDYPPPGETTPCPEESETDYPVPPHPTKYPVPEPEPEHPEYPQPEPEHPQPEPEHPQPEPEHPQPEPEHPQPEPETPAPEPETPAPEPETPAPEPENPAPEPETPAPEPETPAPEPEQPEEPAPTPTQPDEDEPVTVPTAAAAKMDLSVMGSLLGAVLFAAGLM